MIVSEVYTVRSDGVTLIRTYSDIGMKIERDGQIYDEAIDPEGSGRVYVETDQPIEEEIVDEDSSEVSQE